MTDFTPRSVEIKGGATDFEAAVIAVVLDRISQEEADARRGRGLRQTALPAWVRALRPETPRMPREIVRPD